MNLVSLACIGELHVFYCKMKSDWCRYLAEFATGEAKSKAVEDAHVSQVFKQVPEVPKISSRDRIVQCTVEQILDVPVREMVKQLVEVPKTISQDRIQQRNVEQIVDVSVPQVVEELVEVFTCSINRLQAEAPSDASHTSYRDEVEGDREERGF